MLKPLEIGDRVGIEGGQPSEGSSIRAKGFWLSGYHIMRMGVVKRKPKNVAFSVPDLITTRANAVLRRFSQGRTSGPLNHPTNPLVEMQNKCKGRP